MAESVQSGQQARPVQPARKAPPTLYTDATPFLVKHPRIGYLIAVICAIGFFLIAWQVKINGPLTQWDEPFAAWMDQWARSQPFVVVLPMKVLSLLGRDGAGLILVALAVAWIAKGMRRPLGWLLLGTPMGELLYQEAGKLVNRPRPPYKTFEEILGYGFPSGHAATNILLAWLIIALIFPQIRSKFWRIFWSIIVILTVIGILFSRLFLGLHYMTDLFAGALLGTAWGGLVYTSLELYYWRKKDKYGNPNVVRE